MPQSVQIPVGPSDAPYGRANCDGPHGCGREDLRLTEAELLPRHKVPDRTGWCVDSGRWPAESSSGTGAIAHIHP